MDDVIKVFWYTLCAGACIPIGGVLAHMEKIRPKWLEKELRHAVIAFGGGVLLAAVALILVPEGSNYIGYSTLGVFILLSGGVIFFVFERILGLRRREKPQLTAMLLDFIPETLALGGAFAVGLASAPLLAVFIGLQNLPEGFNTYRELRASSKASPISILLFMLMLVPLGPIIAIIGWVYFSDNTFFLGATMLFASGGLLYLILQDIAPQSHMKHHWAPPLGAVLGFCLGMLGNNLASRML